MLSITWYRFISSLCLVVFGGISYGQISYRCIVLDDDGRPLPQVHLTCQSQIAVTDSTGQAVFSNLEVGQTFIELSAVGYQSLEVSVVVDALDVDTIYMTEEVYLLEAIELNASWIAEDQPFSYQTFTNDQLEDRQMGQDVPFLLRWSPSVVVTSDAGTGIGYTGLRIRGSDPTRINVTIDGIPVNDAESQGVFWVDLPDLASSTSAIQIQRGVGTSTNGAGAFGGTINIKSQKLERAPFTDLDVTGGSFGTVRVNVNFGSGILADRFVLDGRVSKMRSDGFIDRSTADLSALQLNARYLTDRRSFRLSLYDGKEITYQAWNGVPQQYVDNPVLRSFNTAGMRADGSFHPDEVDNYRQTHWHAVYKQQINEELYAKGALHYTKGKGYFEQYRVDDDLSDYQLPIVSVGDTIIASSDMIRRRWLDNDFFGAILSITGKPSGRALEWRLGGGHHTYLGNHFGEVIWARFASNSEIDHEYYRNDAKKTDFNFYGQLTGDLTPHLLGFIDMQYRGVNYHFQGFNEALDMTDQEVVHHFINPKAGLTYRFARTEIYLSSAVAHREPNRNDYVDSSPKSRPKAERLIDHELGLRHRSASFRLQSNLYWMNYKDQLILTGQINDVGEYTRINVPNSYRVGFELAGNWNPSARWNLEANGTWSKNRIKEYTELIDNWDTGKQESVKHFQSPIAFSPELTAMMGINFTLVDKSKSSLRLSSLHKYIGSQFLDNTGNKDAMLESYYFSDFLINWEFQPKWADTIGLRLMLRNIFDQHIISNGWLYRYRSSSYDGRRDDPHTALESGNTYNLKGLYPQAGANIMFGLNLKF